MRVGKGWVALQGSLHSMVWQLLLALEPEEQCSLVTRLLSLRGSCEWEGASVARVGTEGVESLKNLGWGT